jgi:hypothetical protein
MKLYLFNLKSLLIVDTAEISFLIFDVINDKDTIEIRALVMKDKFYIVSHESKLVSPRFLYCMFVVTPANTDP